MNYSWCPGARPGTASPPFQVKGITPVIRLAAAIEINNIGAWTNCFRIRSE